METSIASMPVTSFLVAIALLLTLFLLTLKLITAAKKKRRKQRSLIDLINSTLPQTQCGQCGYEGCRPYARAITQGEAINRCPPGSSATIIKLANLLNEAPLPVNPAMALLSLSALRTYVKMNALVVQSALGLALSMQL